MTFILIGLTKSHQIQFHIKDQYPHLINFSTYQIID